MPELITIRQIQNQTTEGGQPYRRVQLAGGRWANVWDAAIELHQGGAYMAELESKPGKQPGVTFWRINSAVPSQAANGQMAEVGKAVLGALDNIRDRRIMAECAAKCATEILKTMPTLDDASLTRERWASVAGWVLDWLLANDGSSKLTDEPF